MNTGSFHAFFTVSLNKEFNSVRLSYGLDLIDNGMNMVYFPSMRSFTKTLDPPAPALTSLSYLKALCRPDCSGYYLLVIVFSQLHDGSCSVTSLLKCPISQVKAA